MRRTDDRRVIKVRPPRSAEDELEKTPMEEAEEMLHRAYGESRAERRLSLAQKALELSTDCAEAWLMLAREGSHEAEKRAELYERAMAASMRIMGSKPFEESVGHFWGILEARPYLRARFGLAETLWEMGRKHEALEHYRELLRLNPGDHQSVRYVLIQRLLSLGLDDSAQSLLQRYEGEESIYWYYTSALVSFRLLGESSRSRELLQRALKRFPKTVSFLLDPSKIPQDERLYYALPSEQRDGIEYAKSFASHWKATAGALQWLDSQEKGES